MQNAADTAECTSLVDASNQLTQLLLNLRTDGGWWEGELSTSALSTATAVMALSLAAKAADGDEDDRQKYQQLIDGGLQWLADNQNDDGGWGDTVLSVSNISTTMLADAVFHAADRQEFASLQAASRKYIDDAGGVDAVLKRYGKDHTFSVPILTHCALAGTVDWKHVIPLPFELSCVPAKFYAAVRMPVVSYALPALIAIGQVIFRHRGHWNPIVSWIRRRATQPALKVLESIQPPNGGFLEATPLTSFVCMSLLGCGYHDHIVTRRCLEFIVASVRDDGSWPIDTNLTTWVTTLSVNAFAGDPHADETDADTWPLDADARDSVREWLLKQQYKKSHPFTNSPPGGWSWTDLPGGVPDADDTPGAMLAVLNLRAVGEDFSPEEVAALQNAATWLLGLQNRDGGWPTFCRGWGTLPFDRSSNDLTAHVLRALVQWQAKVSNIPSRTAAETETAIQKGVEYLKKTQANDGTWLPLWFGNQHNTNDENPLYGTAKVTLALKEIGLQNHDYTQKAIAWLLDNQNDDGSWSARKELPGSTEETALAIEALVGSATAEKAVLAGANWLAGRVEDGTIADPSPIGFYFAKLWYFEQLYPVIFATAALRRCAEAGYFANGKALAVGDVLEGT